MGRQNQRTVQLAFGTSAAAILLISTPATADVGELASSQSEQSTAQTTVTPEDPANVADPETMPNPAIPSAPDDADTQGATSFDTLCNNGQGKPEDGVEVKKRRGIFGMADRLSAMTRKIPLVGDFMVDSANSLSQSVACRLYPEEQKQAAEATQEATRSAEIGKTVEWKSTVRDNVSGSSTIAAKNELANGTPCLTVTDIVFVDAEEVRVSKKMCRLPGTSRYTIMKA